MIYEFTIEEKAKAVIPVRADSPDEAQKIFDEWYNRHDCAPMDSTITDLLDNGYESRLFTRSHGIDEDIYWKMNEGTALANRSTLLPEEQSNPNHNYYSMYVRFADGRKSEHFTEKTLPQIGRLLDSLGEKYILTSDLSTQDQKVQNCFWVHASLKDQEEQWLEIE